MKKYQVFVETILDRIENTPDEFIYHFLDNHTNIKKSLTFSQLQDNIYRLGSILQQYSVQNERCIIFCQSDVHFIMAFFTCMYTGRIAVPAATSYHSGLDNLQHIIQDCSPSVIFTDNPAKLQVDDKMNACLKHIKIIDLNELEEWDDTPISPAHITPESLAFLQYTSGSTHLPKGVMVSNANLIHNLTIIKAKFRNDEHSAGVTWLPPFHDMGLIGGILQPYFARFPAYLMSPLLFIQRPILWLQAITKYKITISGGPNFAYQQSVNKVSAEQLLELDLKSWNVAFCGAEPVNSYTVKAFLEKFAACGFDSKSFYPCYGMAESTLFISGNNKGEEISFLSLDSNALKYNKVLLDDKAGSKILVSCGKPYQGTQIKIVNPESIELCADDEIGEIWINGDSVCQGYWQKPEMSQAVFLAQLPQDKHHYLRTGDLGFIHQGKLFVTGRYKELIIINGKNYYPQDIEAHIQDNEPRLPHNVGAALGIADETKENLVIFHEMASRVSADDYPELIAHIIRTIAQNFSLSVECIILLPKGKLPRTSSGKIKRRYCQELYLSNKIQKISPAFIYSHRGDHGK